MISCTVYETTVEVPTLRPDPYTLGHPDCPGAIVAYP